MNLQPLRKPAKWLGYPLFALTVFFVTLYFSLPRDRIRDRLESMASTQLGCDVRIGDLGLTLFTGPGISASAVTVRTRPPAGEKPLRYVIDEAVVHVGVLALARGAIAGSLDAKAYGGSVEGDLQHSPDLSAVRLDLRTLQIGQIPGLAQLTSLPIDGALSVKGDLRAPKGVVPKAKGSVELTCDNCAVGDGKAKLVIPGDPMLSQGITIPRLRLGKVQGTLVVDKGRATLKDVRAHSADGDIEVDGYLELRDPIQMSAVHLYLRVKVADALLKREPTLEILVSSSAQAKRADGYLGYSIGGTLAALGQPVPAKEPPAGIILGKGIPHAAPASPAAPPARPEPVPFAPPPRPSEPPPPAPALPPSAPAPAPEPSPATPPPAAAPPPAEAPPPVQLERGTVLPPGTKVVIPSESGSGSGAKGADEGKEREEKAKGE